MINLDKVKQDTGATIAILMDENGKLLDSTTTDYAENFALMAETAFSMCNDLLNDLKNSDLQQLIAKSDEHYFIINKLKSNSFLLITSSDLSKLGLLIKYMSSLNK
ncbi:MAG: roadblock/LC7 domain-containing protein [Winogradskyella wichelsiae]